jgi:hypothetical protein
MTDELVKQWDEYVESMGSVMGDVEHMAQQMRDRIEALTAKVAELEACLERQGSGHREDLDEIANVSVERLRRAKAAEAERDRLREALLCGRRLWAIAQDDRIRLLIQLEQCEDRNE